MLIELFNQCFIKGSCARKVKQSHLKRDVTIYKTNIVHYNTHFVSIIRHNNRYTIRSIHLIYYKRIVLLCIMSVIMSGSEIEEGASCACVREKMERQRGEENQADSSCVRCLPTIVKRGFSLERENSST